MGGHPLYKDYEVHINQYFKSINLVNSSLFISKTIDIAQDCIWEADAVNLFQDKLIELILTNTKDVILELNKRDKSNVKSFWEFCFDGSHPKDIENKKLYEKFLVLVDDDEMKKIINEAFQLTILEMKSIEKFKYHQLSHESYMRFYKNPTNLLGLPTMELFPWV
jgi:hypothetical protein